MLSGEPSHLHRLQHFIDSSLSTPVHLQQRLDERIISAHRNHTDQSLRRNQSKSDDDSFVSSRECSSYLLDHCIGIYRAVENTDFSPTEFIGNSSLS